MIESDILRTLQRNVTSAVAASTRPSLPVAYIDTKFTVPNAAPWLEVVHISNNVPNGYWGNERDYRGILRLILHWPNKATGPYAALDLIESIGQGFVKGALIYELPDVGSAVKEGDETLYPLTVRYTSYRKGTA